MDQNQILLISFFLKDLVKLNAIESLTSLVPGIPLNAIPKIHTFLNVFFFRIDFTMLQQYSSFNFLADNIIDVSLMSFKKYKNPLINMVLPQDQILVYLILDIYNYIFPDQIRTGVEAFAELCLATRPQDLNFKINIE